MQHEIRRKFHTWTAAVALVALAGCKTPIVAEIYASDIARSVAGEQVVAALIVGVEIPSNTCAATSAQILAAAQTSFSDLSFVDCRQIGFSNYGRFRAMVPVMIFEGRAPVPDTALAVAATSRDDQVHVGLIANHEQIRAIWDALPADLIGYRNFEFDPAVSAIFHNDLGASTTVQFRDVFADGVAWPNAARVDLDHRSEIEIAASDVANSAFAGRLHTITLGAMAIPEQAQ